MAILGNTWTQIASGSQTINGAKLTYILEAQLTSQSVEDNKSYINTRARTVLGAYASMSSYNWGFTATGCTARSGSGIYYFGTETVLTGSTVVSHSEDGTGTLAMSGTCYGNGIGLSISASGTIELPTIARASKATASPDPLVLSSATNQLVVNTNRATDSFTHTVTLTFGNWTAAQTEVGESTTFSVPQSLVAQMSATEASGTITTTTYNGETQIGTATTSTFRLAVDTTAEHPNIGTVTLTDTNAATAAVEASGSFIKGASNLRAVIAFSVSGSYTTLASATVSVGGTSQTFTLSGSSGSVTFNQSAIASSPLVITVTDNRGYTVSKTVALTIIPYETVAINSVQIYRSNSEGDPSEAGAYIHYEVEVRCFEGTFGVTSNTITLSEADKLSSDSTYGSPTVVGTHTIGGQGQVTTYTFTGVTGGELSASGQYDIKFTVADLFSSAEGTAVLLRGVPIVSWSEDRFCVYGELCVHDKNDTSNHLTISPSAMPETVTVSFSNADSGSVDWTVFRLGRFVAAVCRWRKSSNMAINIAWDNMYNSPGTTTPDFPVTFTDVLYTDIRYVAADSGGDYAAMVVRTPQTEVSLTNMGSAFLVRPDAGITVAHPVFEMMVVGVVGSTPPAPVVTHSITNSLTNVSNSNASASVNDGDSYTATLTPDSGYLIDSVTVTMDGVDITSQVFTGTE